MISFQFKFQVSVPKKAMLKNKSKNTFSMSNVFLLMSRGSWRSAKKSKERKRMDQVAAYVEKFERLVEDEKTKRRWAREENEKWR